MKILIVHQYFLEEDGGGGSRFNQFAKYWSNRGHDITIIAGMVNYNTGKKNEKYRGKFIVKESLSDKIKVIRTHVSQKYNSSFLGRLWGYFSFTFSSTIAGIFHTKRPDLVLVTSPPLFVGICGYLISVLKRVPLIFEVRDLWPESAIDTGVLTNKHIIRLSYWLEAFIYKHSKLINVLTPAFKDKLIKDKGISEEKLIMISNGADLDLMSPGVKDNYIRKKYNIEDKFVILYMGAHGVANNLITLVEVAREMRENKDIVFLFVGDGMQKSELIGKKEDYGLKNIIFVESQPKSKIGDFCNAADVCTAVLKKVETFKTVYPNKVFDYMSCAKPILLGIDGVARSLVEEAQCGIYVEPENVKAYVEAVDKLYKDNELCISMGCSGYKYVTREFSREALAINYETHLLDLLSKVRGVIQ